LTNEAFSRVLIDDQLRDAGWDPKDGRTVRYEVVLPDRTRMDYLLCGANGRPLAVVEAKRASRALGGGEPQAVAYARAVSVPFAFLANGQEVRFRDLDRDAHFRPVATIFGQDELERRAAARQSRRPLSETFTDPRIAGRDYQRACVDALCAAMERGDRRLLVEMATGTGKTRMAAAFVKRLFDASAITRALVLVDRDALAKQAEDAFAEHVPGLACYRVPRTGQRFRPEKQVTVCTLQTMVNLHREYSSGYFDLIVVDECHRSIYGSQRRALDHFDAVTLGLTATPLVGRPPEDADPEDAAAVRDTLRFFGLEAPTFRYTMAEAIAEGHLVPYRVYRAQTVRTAAADGFEVRRGELDWDALDPEARLALDEAFAGADAITVDPAALERRFSIPERNRAIVREFREVLEKGFTGRDGVRRWPQRGKTIVFAVTKRHAETLARLLDEAFADEKPDPATRYADFVVSGMGGEDTPDADTIIKRFKKSPESFPRILVSVNMLDTGFDCPEVVNLVMARFTRSGVLYRQMRGRGTRQAPHIRKRDFTMFDFVGVCDAHGEDDAVLAGGVVVERERPAAPSQPRRLLTLDIHDEIDPATRDWIVYDAEGGTRLATEAEARAERLGARFEAFAAGLGLDAEGERWAGMIGAQLRAQAGTIAAFAAARFARPPFSLRGGLAAAEAAFGGPEGLREFLRRLNAAVFADDPPPGAPPGADAGPRPQA
jgi:type I restriction enzyme, R subunit